MKNISKIWETSIFPEVCIVVVPRLCRHSGKWKCGRRLWTVPYGGHHLCSAHKHTSLVTKRIKHSWTVFRIICVRKKLFLGTDSFCFHECTCSFHSFPTKVSLRPNLTLLEVFLFQIYINTICTNSPWTICKQDNYLLCN